MKALPQPTTRCRVPFTFAPSQLAFGERCLLRGVLSSTGNVASLTANPAAALGSVFHRLLELAIRGEIPRAGMPGDDAERALDRLLDEEDSRLAAVWPHSPPRLRDVFPPLAWRRKRRVILDLAEKYLSGTIPRPGVPGRSTPDARFLSRNGCWSEVRIDAHSLRLRGRVDVVQRTGGDVVIRDLKTGRVVTSDGEIAPHIERQMRLYGAMAHVVWPTALVSLIVDYGIEREVEFTSEQEARVLEWLTGILDRLPSGQDVETELLANVGEACEACVYRHVCPVYRRLAPQYWACDAPVRMPLDTWGDLTTIARRGDGLADMTIRDAAGRTVKIFGVAASRVAELHPGDKVWIFGLRSRDKRGGPESWRHPHNFFEVADDDPFARAWSMQVFVS